MPRDTSTAPVFSVIIPVFNGGKYLKRAIESVLRQTLRNFELILVDDGSTDGAVHRAASTNDNRLSILWQANAGAPSALNRGISAARGEYIAFLDSDDLWAPNKLQCHLEYFTAYPEVDLTFTGLIYVDPDDHPLGLPPRRSQGLFGFEQMFVDYVVGSSSVIAVRKTAVEAAGGFDPTMLYLFDLDLVLRIARSRPSNVLSIPKLLTFYRRHAGQQTSDWGTIATYWTKIVDKYKQLEPLSVKRLEPRAQRNMARYLSYLAYEQGDPSTAWFLLRGAFAADPIAFLTDVRNWKLGLACRSQLSLPESLYRRLVTQAGLRHLIRCPKTP
jgi:hypothetical protein